MIRNYSCSVNELRTPFFAMWIEIFLTKFTSEIWPRLGDVNTAILSKNGDVSFRRN